MTAAVDDAATDAVADSTLTDTTADPTAETSGTSTQAPAVADIDDVPNAPQSDEFALT